MPPQRSLLCSRSCSRSDRGTPHAFVQRSLPPLSFLLRSARTFAAADDAQSALVSVGGRARGTGRGESRAKSHTRRRGSATRRLSRLLSPRYGRAALRDSSVHCDGSVRAERGPAARSGRDRPVPSAGPRFRGDQVTAAAGRERLRGSPGAPVSTAERVRVRIRVRVRLGGGGRGGRRRDAAVLERKDRAGPSPGRPGRPEPFAAVPTERGGGRLGSLGPRAGVGSAGWARPGFRSARPAVPPSCPTSGPAAVPGLQPPAGSRWRSSVPGGTPTLPDRVRSPPRSARWLFQAGPPSSLLCASSCLLPGIAPH